MELFNIKLVDFQDLGELFFRFLFNIGVVFIIIRYIYYPIEGEEIIYYYALISTIIFLLCFLLDNVKLEIGFALGFLHIRLIRYRTQTDSYQRNDISFSGNWDFVIMRLSNKRLSMPNLLNQFISNHCGFSPRNVLLSARSSKL
jgi:hypothetical protein